MREISKVIRLSSFVNFLTLWTKIPCNLNINRPIDKIKLSVFGTCSTKFGIPFYVLSLTKIKVILSAANHQLFSKLIDW